MADLQEPSPSNPEVVTRVQACDSCRRKKIRCQPTALGCAQCSKRDTPCHFTPIAQRKRHRRPAGYKQIAVLESRLQNMESLLGTILNSDPEMISSEDSSPGTVVQNSLSRQPGPSPKKTRSTTPGIAFGEPFTVGHQLVLDQYSDSVLFNSVRRAPALGPFSLSGLHPLPPKPVAYQLVLDAFQSFHQYYPLFSQSRFLRQFQDHYVTCDPSQPAWWACVNVMLCFAHRFRAMRNGEETLQYENSESCGYIHNALSVVSELHMMQRSLPAVQALVGMAILVHGTPNPQPASMLIGSAIRLAQSMGLHRLNGRKEPGMEDEEVEESRRVFWLAYIGDKDISMTMGQPPAQDDDDMDVDLPNYSHELTNDRFKAKGVNLFLSRIALAVIQAQVYKRLYSVAASRLTREEKQAVALDLHSLLRYWMASISIEPLEESLEHTTGPLSTEMIHVLILKLTYVNCLVMVDSHMDGPGNPKGIEYDETIATEESRKSLLWIQSAPQGDYACVWVTIRPLFGAVMNLLQHAIHRPTSASAKCDVEICQPFLLLLQNLSSNEEVCAKSDLAISMYRLCADLKAKNGL